MTWIKSTEHEPPLNERIIVALWSETKGYQPFFATRREDGYEIEGGFEPKQGYLSSQGREESDHLTIFEHTPDWWKELRCNDLDLYEDCPTFMEISNAMQEGRLPFILN